MRTARIRATGEAMPKDSVLENHGSAKIRRRARTLGTAGPDAPGVSCADARDDGRAIPPATSMEKTMNQHVRALGNAIEVEEGESSLLTTILALEAGQEFANRVRGLEDDERNALMEAVYFPHFEKLQNWVSPAMNHGEAVAALRLALHECIESHAPAIATNLLSAALDYFGAGVGAPNNVSEGNGVTHVDDDAADRKWEEAERQTTGWHKHEVSAFSHVCKMEDPLATIKDLLKCLAFLAESLESDVGSVVQRVAWLGIDEFDRVEEMRGELFKLTHPNRDHFEREGWPA